MSRYILSQDGTFLKLNSLGELKLDENGEITAESLLRTLGEFDGIDETVVASDLNDDLANQRFGYLEALDYAVKFNNSEFYNRKGRTEYNTVYDGLMATIHKEANGEYSVMIVKRDAIEEDRFAKHL